ncbi:MAG: hypothetical protein QM706_19465 [Nitrospira sp.]
MMTIRRLDTQALRPWLLTLLLTGATLLTACSPYEMRHENQSNARTQIWLSEESQVKVRAAQTRVFDTRDRRKMLQAIVLTLQDLNCKIEVLDEQLGIVSAKKYVALEQSAFVDPAYFALPSGHPPLPDSKLPLLGSFLSPKRPRADYRFSSHSQRCAARRTSQRSVLPSGC